MTVGSIIAEDRIVIVEEVHLPAADAASWLTRWRRDYLPGARDRGLTLRGVWRGSDGRPDVVVVVCWSVRGAGPFWAARFAATEDPEVRRFWADTDHLALRRERRVLANDGLPDD